MLYTPMLPEAASGTLEPRHTVVPLRVMCPHSDLLLGNLRSVDIAAQTATIHTEEGEVVVSWQQLVLALGAIPRVVPVPGLAEHGPSFKSPPGAIKLRNHLLRQLEAGGPGSRLPGRRRRLPFRLTGPGRARLSGP